MANTSLGTAWIQIKPSLKGVTSDLKKEFAGAGTASGGTFSTGFAAKMGAVGGLVSAAVNKATSAVTSSISSAISRVDTLNNFPRVMSNLGIAADASSSAIRKISDNIQGLPTTLNDAASAVQRFTSKNGDVQKSADYFLAVNNALLAGGQGADIQATALEQLSQAYSKGRLDMVEWRSLLVAMPAQINQIAQAMGMSADDLGEGLRNGTIPIDNFMDKIVELNTTGVGEFASFAEQAKSATGGIGTAIEVMKSRITQGVAAAIDAIGSENISNIATVIGNAFRDIGKALAEVIKFVQANKDWIVPLTIALGGFAAAVMAINKALVVYKTIQTAVNAINIAFNAILNMNPIFLIITAVAALTAGLIWFFTQTETGKAVAEAIGKWFGDAFKVIGAVIGKIGEAISSIWNAITSFIGNVWNAITSFIANVSSIFGGIATWVWQNVLEPIINFIKNWVILAVAIWATIAQFFYNVIIQPIVNFVVGAWNTITGIIQSIINGIIAFFTPIVEWFNATIIAPISAFFTGLWNGLTEGMNNLWNGIVVGVTSFVNTFTGIIGTISGWINGNVIQPIASFFNGLWEGIKAGVNAVKSAISTVFGAIGGIIKAPINGIISAINHVIDMINGIQVPDWVPVIGGSHTNFGHIPTLATGGRIFGEGTGTSDSNLVALSSGEYVIRAAAAQQIGYDKLDYLNETGELGGSDAVINITINGYNKDPNELADIISRKIALKQHGVLA